MRYVVLDESGRQVSPPRTDEKVAKEDLSILRWLGYVGLSLEECR